MNDKMTKVKDLLVGVDSKVQIIGGESITGINFDNAATTPPFKSVVESIEELSKYYGSIGRGVGEKAEITSKIFHESRKYLLNFFNLEDENKYTVIYVKNATDGINTLARTLIKSEKDIVISTRMEHHSNDLPWRRHCKVEYIDVDALGRLKLDELEDMLKKYKGRVKIVTVTGASNVTGYINPIHEIAKIVHKYNGKIIVDGAQLVPHVKVNIPGKMDGEEIDYLVFSGHKLYAPFGAGVIVGLKEDFEKELPDNEGGGTVDIVLDYSVEYLNPPEKNEAGTPNFFGITSIVKALQELDNIGFENIIDHEMILRNRLLCGLSSIERIRTYGDIVNKEDRLGIGVFNIEGMFHQQVAEKLARIYGISVRQGWFCAHPYCRRLMGLSERDTVKFIKDEKLGIPGMIRASFGIYNSEEEVDYFLNAIEDIIKHSK